MDPALPLSIPSRMISELYIRQEDGCMLDSKEEKEMVVKCLEAAILRRVSKILEAITTLKCSEEFSLEHLELLGDSVLKYAVSCNLFLNFPEKHEGQLSSHRSHLVCNAALHKLGVQRNLQVNFIRHLIRKGRSRRSDKAAWWPCYRICQQEDN